MKLTRLQAIVAIVLSVAGLAVAGATTAPARADAPPPAGAFVAVAPTRLLDTRTSNTPITARGTISLPISTPGVSPADIGAAVLNVTAVTPGDGGYVTVYPNGATQPTTSDINFRAGQTQAHSVIARLGTSGAIRIYNGSDAALQVVVDLSGYYTAGTASGQGAYVPLTPSRLLDTRTGAGRPVAAGGQVTISPLGHAGIPTRGVSAVVLNLTATAATRRGYISILGSRTSVVSSVNLVPGQTVSNLAIAPIGLVPTVTLANGSNGTVHLIADVAGYFLDGAPDAPGRFGAEPLNRILDTRTDRSAIAPGATRTLDVTGNGVPATGLTAVAINVTAATPTHSGHLTVYASGTARPNTSTLNFGTRSVANLVIAPVGADGRIAVYNASPAPLDVVVDLAGFVAPVPGPLRWTSPQIAHRVVVPNEDTDARAISCASPAFCAIVDQYGEANTFNGSSWSKPVAVAPAGTLLDSVSCPSSTFCVAVGSDAHPFVYRNGTWSTGPSSGQESLGPVSCTSVTFCVVLADPGDVGPGGPGDALAMTFDGTRWSAPATLPGSADSALSLSCASPSFCLVVGAIASYAFDGSTWTQTPGESVSFDGTTACPSATSCIAIGRGTAGSLAEATFDGASWSPQTPVDLGLSTNVACGAGVCVLGGRGIVALRTASGWTDGAGLDPLGYLISATCTADGTFCALVDTDGDVILGSR